MPLPGALPKTKNEFRQWQADFARVSQLASQGVQLPYGGPRLPRWMKARDMAIVGAALTPARIAFVGDSKTAGAGAGVGTNLMTGAFAKSRVARVAALLAASVPTYQGFCGYNGNPSPADRMNYDPRLQLANAGGGNRSLGGGMMTTGVNGAFMTYSQGQAVNRFSFLVQGGADRGTYSVTKGNETLPIAPAGPAGVFTRQEFVFATKDNAPIVVARTGGPAGIIAVGGVAWDSTAPGVEILNMGVYGIATTALVARQGNNGMDFLPALATYAPHLTIINIGTNDLPDSTNVSLATYLANVRAIIAQAQLSGDVVVCWPAVAGVAPSGGGDTKRATWSAALQALADDRGCLFLNEEALLGGRAAAQAAGAFADALHEAAWAYQTEAAPIARLLLA